MSNKKIDFYKAYNKKPEMSARTKSRLLLFAPPAALLLIFAVVIGVMAIKYARLGGEIKAERAYLDNADVTADYAEYESLGEELQAVYAVNEQFAGAKAAVDSYPRVDAALIGKALDAAADVSVTSYAYSDDGGLLTVSGSCNSVENAAQYAKALEALGAFNYVGYYGYASQNGRNYTFTVQCVLAQGVTE